MGFFLCALFDSLGRNCDWQFDSLFFAAKARSVLRFLNFGGVRTLVVVIAGLDPVIHAAPSNLRQFSMDARVKPAHDEGKNARNSRRVRIVPSPLAGEGDSAVQQQEWVRGRARRNPSPDRAC
jgi:hypothetical protein